MKLLELMDNVKDEESFLIFARALKNDRKDGVAKEIIETGNPWGHGANGWENATIEAFLDAAIRWAEDSDFGENQDLQGASPWQKFASFLWCGKIYE